MRAQFDREQVLKNSTELFWQRGYNAASMQQVVKVTKLKPGSLYLAFGNKEGLFRASLEYYAKQALARIQGVLDSAPSVGLGFCQILARMVNEAESKDYCSCFLIKSQLELSANGDELAETASQYLVRMEDIYTEYLSREYAPDQARQYATALMVHIYGIRVYSYLRRPSQTMLDALEAGLPWLPWQAFKTAN